MPTLYAIGRAKEGRQKLNMLKPGDSEALEIKVNGEPSDKVIFVKCDEQDKDTSIYAAPSSLFQDNEPVATERIFIPEYEIGRTMVGDVVSFEITSQSGKHNPIELHVIHAGISVDNMTPDSFN